MYPNLVFFTELEIDDLQKLFADEQVIRDLQHLKAGVGLGILDLSPERAAIARRLNQAGIPVHAWLLLPIEQGYWFNADNVEHAAALYDSFCEWTEKENLIWTMIGLDIEPDIRIVHALLRSEWRVLPGMVGRALNPCRLRRALTAYQALIERIHTDGYCVESYQMPFIVDDRIARSHFLQRLLGILDLATDREVLMLYSSFARPIGAGLLWSYAPSTRAFGLGVTGGGVDLQNNPGQPLDWQEFSRDLRLAWYWGNYLYIFSLEGCVQQKYLSRLKDFVWDAPITEPGQVERRVTNWRSFFQGILWSLAHLPVLLFAALGLLAVLSYIRRRRS